MKKTLWWRQNRFSCAQEMIVRQSAGETPANNLNPWDKRRFCARRSVAIHNGAFLQFD